MTRKLESVSVGIKTQKTPDTKTCFIITPVGDELSEERRQADGLINSVIKPVLEDKGYKVDASHLQSTSGSITKEIIRDVYNADLVIADLTGGNPNCMYEVAIRHSCNKPIIHVMERGKSFIFDVKDIRTLIYDNDMFGVCKAKEELGKMVDSISDRNMDSPVFEAIQNVIIDKPTNVEVGIVDYLLSIEKKVDRLAFDQKRFELKYRNSLIKPGANIEAESNLSIHRDFGASYNGYVGPDSFEKAMALVKDSMNFFKDLNIDDSALVLQRVFPKLSKDEIRKVIDIAILQSKIENE